MREGYRERGFDRGREIGREGDRVRGLGREGEREGDREI